MRRVVIALIAVGFIGATLPPALAQTSEDALVLDGVIIADNPAHSVALIRRAGARRARPLRIGSSYGGYVLVEVTRTSVLLEGAREDLRLALGGGSATSETADARAESVKLRDDSDWVRRSFSRIETSAILEKQIPVILSDTELTPRVVEGEVRGLEVLRLPDGTVLSRSGLLPGDILKSLNEQPLRGLDSLWQILASFEDVDELRLVLERRGEVVRFAYALTN